MVLALLVFVVLPQVLYGWGTFVRPDFSPSTGHLVEFQRESFQRGELPFWQPAAFGGGPFLAQWHTLPLYPPALIYLRLPLGWSLSFFCLLHLWFAGLGMFFLARRWSAPPFVAAVAGTLFPSVGLLFGLHLWPNQIAAFAWLPWVVLTAEAAWRQGMQKLMLAAFVGALQMFAGSPRIILLTWLVVSALWLHQFLTNSSPRGAMLWRLPLVVALVGLLAAAQLLPYLDLRQHAKQTRLQTDASRHWQPNSRVLPLVTAGQKPVFLADSNAFAALDNFDPRQTVFLPPEAGAHVTVSHQTSATILNAKLGPQTVDAEVAASEPALVVVAQAYNPNWRAEVDSQAAPLWRADVAFRAVPVPAGNHRVHLVYQDRAFEIGAAISLCLWVNCLISFALMRPRPPVPPAAPDDEDSYFS